MTEKIEPANVPHVTPKHVKVIQDNLGPLNTLYLIPASLAGIFDLFSPFGPFLIIASIITGLLVLYNFINRNKVTKNGQILKKSRYFIFGIVSFLVFSASATANFNHKTDGGALANWVPSIKKWQDAYLVSIKKDTEEINKKIDKTNIMLTQISENMRLQLEKPLIEEIPQYAKLSTNQKNALVLFTKKVGTNGIKKYHTLIAATNKYLDKPTNENAHDVGALFKYVVRVNGKNIEDTKTKVLMMSLFLSPETYDYLTGVGALPADTSLLKELNIDISKPVQLDDPLGQYIAQYQLENGTEPAQQVVIPKEETVNNIVEPVNPHTVVRPQRPANFNHRYM